MEKQRKQEEDFGEFYDNQKVCGEAIDAIYEFVRAAFKAGWEKGEEHAKQP